MKLLAALQIGAFAAAATLAVSLGGEPAGQPFDANTDFGFSPGSVVLNLSDEQLGADLAAIEAIGATWIRIDVDWSHVESDQGAFDWSEPDRIIDAANDHGLQVIAMLAYTPRWARPEGSSDKHPPTDPAAFAGFAAAAADRYGSKVSAWEVWNEPNTRNFWEPSPDPVAYAELFNLAADELHAADQDAIVLTAGLAPATNRDGQELSPLTFLEQTLPEIDRSSIDAVAIHPYSYPESPSNRFVSWSLFAQLLDIRDYVADVLDPSIQIWLTEYGAPTGISDRAVSEPNQALLVFDALGCANTLDWIGPILLYSIRDIADGDSDDAEDNFGLLFADGTPKDAWRSLSGEAPPPSTDSCRDWPGVG